MSKLQEKKSEIINIRITPAQRKLIDENNLSPTEIFNKMVSDEVLEKRKNIARTNLDKYPTIKFLFREEWVLEQIDKLKFKPKEGVDGHGLAWLLSNARDEKLIANFEKNMENAVKGDVDSGMMAYMQGNYIYEPLLKIGDLERNLGILRNEKGIRSMIKKAKNNDQFWKTLSEIEVAAQFKTKGILKELEPKINGKTPDNTITLDKEEFCVEVFTPGLSQELEESLRTGKAVFMKNRAFEKLDEKIDQLPKGKPAIIVINTAFSDIDSMNITDAILGSLSLLISRDPKKEPKTTRKQDGLAQTKDLSNIKSIIIYKRGFNLNRSLVTNMEVKRLVRNSKDDMTKTQEKILVDVFSSMIFDLED